MLDHGDVRCGDCGHFTDEGCEEAAEALALEGWPRAAVCPEDSADASRCPEFTPGEGCLLAMAEECSGREARDRVAAVRSFMYS
ncbi:MAG: hypothetical protein HY916_02370 [Desulfovibrio sp.]|jgi:hypothetical protein|nr:hypothetical protein [Desulfovibrio sp.]